MKKAILFLCLATFATADCVAADTTHSIDEIFQHLDDNGLFQGAVLVADDGEVVYEHASSYANHEWEIPNTVDTRFRIGSISKQFTAMLVLMLVEEGKLTLSDPVGKHLPELERHWIDDVTIHHLLSQTSGIPNYTLLDGYMDSISKNRYSRDEFLELLIADALIDSLHFEPGSNFDYSNTNYFFAGIIVERIAGKPFEAVLQERILDPLGMKDTGAFDDLKLIPRRAYGYEKSPDDSYEPTKHSSVSPKSVPSGGLYSTARDLFKWHRALQENRLLGEDLMEPFSTPHHWFSDSDGYAYGNYYEEYALDDATSLAVLEHGGSAFGTSTMIYRLPDEDELVVLLLNGGIGRETFLTTIAFAIIDVLHGKETPLPKCPLLGVIGYTAITKDGAAVLEHYRFLKKHRSQAYEFNPGELSMLGHILIQILGDRATAEDIFLMNADEYPGEPSVYIDLGRHYLQDGEKAKALEYLRKAVPLSGDDDELDQLLEEAES